MHLPLAAISKADANSITMVVLALCFTLLIHFLRQSKQKDPP